MTPYEWFKFVVMMPVFIFRCFLTVLCMPFVFVVLRLCLLGTTVNEPLVGWRRAFVRAFLMYWSHILLHIGFNIWPRITGYENVAKAYDCRATLVFNHVSYTDGIMLGAFFLPCGLAKASVADIPFFGAFAKGCSFLFVERRGSTDEAKTVHASKGSTTELIHERAADPRFPLFAIAPEGTCKHHNVLLRFSSGAFVGGRPVLPVLLKYRSKHFHQGWGRVQSSLWHFMRGQTQFINLADVEVLPPYIPSAEERADPRLYAENVRRLMAEKLGAQLSPQGIREQQLLKRHGVCVDWTGRQLKMRSGSVPAKPAAVHPEA
ncbi:hypothetical protein WJX75_001079 [Coccomyxa subellipsoidea]|uniref:Phospholipid/glycerol acyltransferase domain-containing protein n=1 Tax=Coccomyxa subellipsoidea TaxID=248742 RepID=A0ABR2YAY0_9CHLO